VIRDSPQFENSAGDERFGRLRDAGFFDLFRIRGRVRWWVVVLETRNVDVVAIVRMPPPTEVHAGRIRVVKFVVSVYRPLDVDPSSFGFAKTIVERHFENGGVEVIV
jgi:hypothetical protein